MSPPPRPKSPQSPQSPPPPATRPPTTARPPTFQGHNRFQRPYVPHVPLHHHTQIPPPPPPLYEELRPYHRVGWNRYTVDPRAVPVWERRYVGADYRREYGRGYGQAEESRYRRYAHQQQQDRVYGYHQQQQQQQQQGNMHPPNHRSVAQKRKRDENEESLEQEKQQQPAPSRRPQPAPSTAPQPVPAFGSAGKVPKLAAATGIPVSSAAVRHPVANTGSKQGTISQLEGKRGKEGKRDVPPSPRPPDLLMTGAKAVNVEGGERSKIPAAAMKEGAEATDKSKNKISKPQPTAPARPLPLTTPAQTQSQNSPSSIPISSKPPSISNPPSSTSQTLQTAPPAAPSKAPSTALPTVAPTATPTAPASTHPTTSAQPVPSQTRPRPPQIASHYTLAHRRCRPFLIDDCNICIAFTSSPLSNITDTNNNYNNCNDNDNDDDEDVRQFYFCHRCRCYQLAFEPTASRKQMRRDGDDATFTEHEDSEDRGENSSSGGVCAGDGAALHLRTHCTTCSHDLVGCKKCKRLNLGNVFVRMRGECGWRICGRGCVLE